MNRVIYKNTKIVEFRNKLGKFTPFNKFRHYSTSTRSINSTNYQHLNSITPLKRPALLGGNFYTLDIETIDVNGFQQPLVITFQNKNVTKAFICQNTKSDSVINIWIEFFEYLFVNVKNKNNVIFIQNLGGFDGVFLHKFVINLCDNVETIIDDSNKYILIKVIYDSRTYIFKDSYRVFPVSLNDLCKVFNVPGKLSDYNPDWNNSNVLKNSIIMNDLVEYAKQDTSSLYSALKNAQEHFINKYGVDITTVVSLPSLALKIFRLKYLDKNIPILNSFNDSYVRKSYFGGAVDIYQAYQKNAYYYDKNSLYPEAMCEIMPLNVIETLVEPSNLDLNNFYGFLDVDIECPNTIIKPVLPFKHEGRTIFPQGIFNGVYFSEEIKAVLPLGYKILRIHSAKRFDKADIFNDYVKEMYQLKAVTTGAERWIVKLLLNSLYGIFGRKQDTIKTIIINNDKLEVYLASHDIKNIIPIDNNKSILLIFDRQNNDLLNDLNNVMDDDTFNLVKSPIKSNVAIASDITAHARIKMIPYKLLPGSIYSDTDSIITTEPLPDNLIGKELGLMKDELNGSIIKEILVLGCKQYGYHYILSNNNIIEKSVWAGVTRDSLTFQELKTLFKGRINY